MGTNTVHNYDESSVMRTDDVLAVLHPDRAEAIKILARMLRIKNRQSIYQWGEFVPRNRHFEIQVLTKGKIKAPRSDAV